MANEQRHYVPGDLLLERYTVEKVLGRGAFGEVLQVADRETERQYALKYVPPEIARDTAQMQAIRTNFRLVSELTHPHIAVVRHLLTDPAAGQVFVLMDLVRGQSLSQWMKGRREALGDPQAPIELPIVLGIAEQLASALDYAHTQPAGFHSDGSISRYGILHRDLKPDNVMVDSARTYRAGVPYTKVVDFGLAAEIQASLQSMTSLQVDLNQVAGSPAYMSPEQWTGRRLTRGIDQWALAVMIYEMAEGRLPFHGLTFSDLRDQVLRSQYQAPEYLNAAQWEALRISFNTDRTHRHRSCLALVKAVADAEPSTRNSVCVAEVAMPNEAGGQTPFAPVHHEHGGGGVAVLANEPAVQLATGTLCPAFAEQTPNDTVSHIDAKVETHEYLNVAPNRLAPQRVKSLSTKKWAVTSTLALLIIAVAGVVVWRPNPAGDDDSIKIDTKMDTAVDHQTAKTQRATELSPQPPIDETHGLSAVTPDGSATLASIPEPDPEDPPVSALPAPPVVVLPIEFKAVEPCLIAPGEEAVIQFTAIDPNVPPAPLRYALVGAALPGTTIDETSGKVRWKSLSGTPSGAYTITVEARSENPAARTATQQATILVKAAVVDLAGAELRVDGGGIRMMLTTALSADGSQALVGCDDGTARLWDTSTGKELQRFIGHSGAVNSVALSVDATRIFTGGEDGTARLWDAASGKELQRFAGHSGAVNSVALSYNATRALTGGDDATARLWDTSTGKELQRFNGHPSSVRSVALSADGTMALTGGDDKTARLWDAMSGKELQRFTGHTKAITAVALSSDGTTVLTGSEDATARLWNTGSGAPLQRFDGHSGSINAVALSADGTSVLTAGYDYAARLWEITSGKELKQFNGHTNSISSVALSIDGTRALTASDDGTARLWDISNGGELSRLENHNYRAASVALSPDGSRLLIGGVDDSARLWDTRGGKELQRFKGHFNSVGAVALSADCSRVLTASFDNTARLWDAASGKELDRFEGHSGAVISAALSADNMRALTGSDDSTARLWDTTSGQEVQRFVGHTKSVNSVAISSSGSRVMTGGDDNTARLWDAAIGKELKRFSGHSDSVRFVSLSGNGLKAVTASADNTARLWDSNSGKELQRFEGHSNWVRSVALSDDGATALTASDDKTARLWATSTGKELQRFTGHTGGVYFAAFLPGERDVLTAGYDETIRVWNSTTGTEICQLITLNDGSYVVVATDHRYDSSLSGNIAHVYWWQQAKCIPFEQLKDRYHVPGLAKQLLDFTK